MMYSKSALFTFESHFAALYAATHLTSAILHLFTPSLAKDWPTYISVRIDKQEWQVEARQECQPVKVAFSSLEWKSYELEENP